MDHLWVLKFNRPIDQTKKKKILVKNKNILFNLILYKQDKEITIFKNKSKPNKKNI